MTCVACNSLKARNKTCWRHPVPGVPVIEVDHATVPSAPGKPATSPSTAPINHDANLNSLFPQHNGYPKKPLAIVTLSWRFGCDCGAILEYFDHGNGPISLPAGPPPPQYPAGTKIQARHGMLVWTIDTVHTATDGSLWYHCSLGQGRYAVRIEAVDGRSWFVVP